MGVVDRMEVVVEKQHRQRPAVLDDDAARRRPLVRLVLEEGADAQDAERRPAAGQIRQTGIVPTSASHADHRQSPARCSAQARATPRSPARERRQSSRHMHPVAEERPERPSARAACCWPRAAAAPAGEPRPDAPGRDSWTPGRRAGRSAAGRSGARDAGRGTAGTGSTVRSPDRPARRSAACPASGGRGWPRAAARNAAPATTASSGTRHPQARARRRGRSPSPRPGPSPRPAGQASATRRARPARTRRATCVHFTAVPTDLSLSHSAMRGRPIVDNSVNSVWKTDYRSAFHDKCQRIHMHRTSGWSNPWTSASSPPPSASACSRCSARSAAASPPSCATPASTARR